MEVIDLLNKIVNGEAVPKMIYYGAKTYHYNNYNHSYIHYNIMDKEEYLTTNYRIEQILNDEIEIIEEDKQIEKIEINYARDIEEKIFYEESDKPNHCILGDAGTELLINKINEIIDKLNKLKKENE